MSALDCPVCYDILTPPIFQCANGHVICKDCIERLEESGHRECPTCRVSMIRRIRCLFADQQCEGTTSPENRNSRSQPYNFEIPRPLLHREPLPKASQESARRFSLAACARNDALQLITAHVRKISDERLLFPSTDKCHTFQVQIEMARMPSLLVEYLKSRTFPKSITDLRNAGIKVYVAPGKVCLYEEARRSSFLEVVAILHEMAASIGRPFIARHNIWADARVFEATPPHLRSWITMVISCQERVSIHFEGDHKFYGDRMDIHGVSGVYDDNNNFVRGMSFDPTRQVVEILLVLERVFENLSMKVRVRDPHPILNSPAEVFIARLRESRNLYFVD